MKRLAWIALLLSVMAVTGAAEGWAARLVAHVNLTHQTMTVTQDGRTLYHWPISSGRKGYRTPTGTYSPKRMHRMWYSRKYDMSPMPYSIFFRGGYAIHGTSYVRRLGHPASHGCIRLHTEHARTLYNLTRRVGPANMRVRIRY